MEAADIDWATCRVFEKLDGSLTILYWLHGSWQVASSGKPDASSMVAYNDPGGRLPMRELFWQTWEERGYRLPTPPGDDRSHYRCYMFELTSPRHPIVVQYSDAALTLIGCRNMHTLQEEDPAPIAAALAGGYNKKWMCGRSAVKREQVPSLLILSAGQHRLCMGRKTKAL
ncbi:unnamed protein product [Symbiodinium natans]|uniref:Uncharacterized protein n=1 Tax=Symbiodinium natans TaxID=878477 RepID=A0A812UXE4_9DINO|nr:unnamed protein product [Symbiodinium natans]